MKGFKVDWDSAPTYLMLIVTELSEAMEQWRDDQKEGFKEEIADAFIRLFPSDRRFRAQRRNGEQYTGQVKV